MVCFDCPGLKISFPIEHHWLSNSLVWGVDSETGVAKCCGGLL